VDQPAINRHLKKLLEEYQRVIMDVQEEIEGLEGVEEEKKNMLARRWKQIVAIVRKVGGEL
jgi:hypothetical protein